MSQEEILKDKQGLVTMFLFEMNVLLDSEETRDSLKFNEARDNVESGNVVDFIRERYKGKIDLSLFQDEFKEAFNGKMADIAGGFYGSERKKVGVVTNGLCLLIAYATELVQQLRR